ncbi:MAG: phenylacetate--CoA ligase [Victivallaceae bacterium]|nr:phenylacetate--CoA ligase [Victivallaceae bacterium]
MEQLYFNRREECLSRDEINLIQQERLLKLIRYAAGHCDFHRARFEAAGIDPEHFRGMEDLDKLPFLTKIDFREQYPDRMCCVSRDKIREMHMSSGTSGTPVVMLYTEHDLDQWAECMARCLRMAGVREHDVFQFTPGLGLFNGGFGCYHGGRKAGCFVIPAGPGNTPRQIKLAKDMHTNAMLCVVSYGARILEVMQEMKETLPDLRVGIFGAETFSEAMKERLRSGFGIDVFDIYGMTETGGIGTLGQDCSFHQGTHVWEDHYLAEIIDPATGKEVPDGTLGELVVTSLTREAIPVIRFRTGDLTKVLSRDRCECGRTHLRLAPIAGRVDDMLIIKGVNFFPSQIEQSLLKIPGVSTEYQLYIDDVDGMKKLYVKVEADSSVTGYTVSRQLKEDLGFAVDGEVVPPGSLPRTEGKARRVFQLHNGVAGK